MGWVRPSEINVGDLVASYGGVYVLEITAIEPNVPNPNCGTAYRFTSTRVDGEQVTFEWPTRHTIYRTKEADQ